MPSDVDTPENHGKLRPLQLWLRTRPDGMGVDERATEWKNLTADEKKKFSLTTKAERGVR